MCTLPSGVHRRGRPISSVKEQGLSLKMMRKLTEGAVEMLGELVHEWVYTFLTECATVCRLRLERLNAAWKEGRADCAFRSVS
jgi:hypothetical protein